MGSRVDDVGVRGLCRTREEEFQGTCLQSFTKSLAVECFGHGREEAANLDVTLSRELLQGRVQKVDLALLLLEREVGVWVYLSRTFCEVIMKVVYHRT